ncbi:hypothetical protein Tco_1099433 [Tanacetum coccineum]
MTHNDHNIYVKWDHDMQRYLSRSKLLASMLSLTDSICSGGGGTDGGSDGESGLVLLRDENGNSDENSGYQVDDGAALHQFMDALLYPMAKLVAANQIARRVIDDLVDFSGEMSVPRYTKFFFEQQISDRCRFINRMREEVQTSKNLLGQLTALIAELEASPNPGELFDTLMCLRDDVRDEHARLGALNDCIT